ncbi:MAG TPA: hypothetical protein VF824_21750 [Thermoanaerobaculia bacterium]|jgi:tetratricopeptide (TPR) repeat protein
MRRAPAIAAVAVTALVAAAVAYRWVWIPNRCNAQITDFERQAMIATEAPTVEQSILLARSVLDGLRRIEPQCSAHPNLYMLMAFDEQTLGHREEAIATYRRLLRIAPRPEVYRAIGDLYFELGRIDEAVDNYVLACRFDPSMVERLDALEAQELVRKRLLRGTGSSL